MSRTMTKPKKLRDERTNEQKDERVLPAGVAEVVELQQEYLEANDVAEIVKELLTPRRYVPPQCTMCTALRGDDKNDYTRVVSTQRETGLIVRYCKCGFCGNTFKDLERI